MKKIISLLAVVLLAQYATAQNSQINQTVNDYAPSLSKDGMPTPTKINLNTLKKTRAGSRWYDIVDAVDKDNGGAGTIYSNAAYNLIWTDSTILAPFNGTSGVVYDGVWIKSVADFLDPVDYRYNDPFSYAGEMALDRNKDYKIDSLFIPFVYTRNANKPNVVDTLIISVIQSDGQGTNNDLDIRYYGPTSQTAANHLTDTLRFLHGFLDLNASSSSAYTFIPSAPANVVNKKIPLTAASAIDTTSNGFNYVQIPVNLNVPAGSVVATSVVFKTGDTWTPYVDTIYISGSFSTPNFNNFRFVAFEEVANGFQKYTKGYWSQSSIMRNDTNGWANWHIPSFAFTATAYEHQWFQYLVSCATCGSVGVDDLNASINQFSLYPNPAYHQTTLSFSTKNEIHNAEVSLLGLSGNVISNAPLGNIKATQNIHHTMSTRHLAPGFYLVKLSSDEGQYVQKIIVH